LKHGIQSAFNGRFREGDQDGIINVGAPNHSVVSRRPDNPATALLPTIYRPQADGRKLDENQIVQSFRRMAPGYIKTPELGQIDQWLFLMQHLRVPTRLLDWTEGALIALYFAIEFAKPVIWMLNPDELNALSVEGGKLTPRAYPLTWLSRGNNIGSINIRAAWELDRQGPALPVAIKPTYVHQRMGAQKSCFTIHGADKRPLGQLVSDSVLAKFKVSPRARPALGRELQMLGVTQTSVFPEADSLAAEIKELASYQPDSDLSLDSRDD
jgi:hypothetical protein